MNRDPDQYAARAAPVVFVVLWSTGFVATKYALAGAEPLTYLMWRMMVVVALMALIVAIWRPRWPDWKGIGHSAVAGLLVHGFYLGGTSVAIAHSVPVGLSALIPGLQPVLISTLANRWLGERVTWLQWTGLLMGLGGVILILHDRPLTGEVGWGWLASGSVGSAPSQPSPANVTPMTPRLMALLWALAPVFWCPATDSPAVMPKLRPPNTGFTL